MDDYNDLPNNSGTQVYEKQPIKVLLNRVQACESVYVFAKVGDHIYTYVRAMKTDVIEKLRAALKYNPRVDFEKFDFVTKDTAVFIN